MIKLLGRLELSEVPKNILLTALISGGGAFNDSYKNKLTNYILLGFLEDS